MKEKQTVENTKQISLKLPIEIYKKIEELREGSERTTSQQIRYMLQKYIDIQENILQKPTQTQVHKNAM